MKNLWLKVSCLLVILVLLLALALSVAWVGATWALRNNCLDYGNPPAECKDLTINPLD